MKRNRILIILFAILITTGAKAQLKETIQQILGSDSTQTISSATSSDSIRIKQMQQELETARLNEANMRLEMEQLRLETFSADSLKQAQQKMRIDSLRRVTKGVPVIVEGDTLFYLYTKRGGYTPQTRAEMDAAIITELGEQFNLHPDSVYIENSDIVSDIMYGNKVIVSFTDQDGLWENSTREQLAEHVRTIIVNKLKTMHEEHSFIQLCKRILYFILVLAGQYLLFRITLWLYRKTKLALLHPLLVSIPALVAVMSVIGIPYESFQQGSRMINFLLGPSVVALGYVLWEQVEYMKSNAVSIMTSIFVGSLVGIVSVICIARWMGADHVLIATLEPKSVTK